MLSSFNSHEDPPKEPSYHHRNTTRQLLLSCAEHVHHADFASAHRLLSLLSATASPFGDSTDRLAYQLTQALSLRLTHLSLLPTVPTTLPFSTLPPPPLPDRDTLHSSYLSLNQITPFVRFSHLTANQAILEALGGHRSLHVIDFDTMHGVQWPPLMQAIAERSDPNDPHSIRITSTGTDIETLRRTGDRLKTFANSLGLKFQFCPVPSYDNSVELHAGDVLAVNCVHFMHKMLRDDRYGSDGAADLRIFLRSVKAMNPAVVTVAEKEAYHNSAKFLQRFKEALDHYTAVFESMEATVPPGSRERMAVEQVWFGREIADIVAAEGDGRRERHERFEQWEKVMSSVGFVAVPLSPFALSQAKLLLRLHYPSEGYQLQVVKDALFLGWKSRAIFSMVGWPFWRRGKEPSVIKIEQLLRDFVKPIKIERLATADLCRIRSRERKGLRMAVAMHVRKPKP